MKLLLIPFLLLLQVSRATAGSTPSTESICADLLARNAVVTDNPERVSLLADLFLVDYPFLVSDRFFQIALESTKHAIANRWTKNLPEYELYRKEFLVKNWMEGMKPEHFGQELDAIKQEELAESLFRNSAEMTWDAVTREFSQSSVPVLAKNFDLRIGDAEALKKLITLVRLMPDLNEAMIKLFNLYLYHARSNLVHLMAMSKVSPDSLHSKNGLLKLPFAPLRLLLPKTYTFIAHDVAQEWTKESPRKSTLSNLRQAVGQSGGEGEFALPTVPLQAEAFNELIVRVGRLPNADQFGSVSSIVTLDQDFRRIAHEAALVGMTDEEAFRSRALWNDFAALFNTPEMAITPRSKWVRKMDAYIAHVEKYALSLGRQRKVLAQVVDALLPLTHGGEARMGAPGSGEFSHAEQLRKLELARLVSRLTELKAEFSQMEKGLEGEQRKCERIQSELFSFSRAAASTALTSQSDFITAAKTLLSRVLSDVGVPAPKKSGIRFWSDSR